MDRAIVSPCEREERTALRLGTRSRTAPAASHSMVQTTPPPTLRSGLIGTRAPSMVWSKRPPLRPSGPCSVGPCHALGHAMDRGPRPARRRLIRRRTGHPMVQPYHDPVGRPDAGRRSPSDRRPALAGRCPRPGRAVEVNHGMVCRRGRGAARTRKRAAAAAASWAAVGDGAAASRWSSTRPDSSCRPNHGMARAQPWDGLCHGMACARSWNGLRSTMDPTMGRPAPNHGMACAANHRMV